MAVKWKLNSQATGSSPVLPPRGAWYPKSRSPVHQLATSTPPPQPPPDNSVVRRPVLPQGGNGLDMDRETRVSGSSGGKAMYS